MAKKCIITIEKKPKLYAIAWTVNRPSTDKNIHDIISGKTDYQYSYEKNKTTYTDRNRQIVGLNLEQEINYKMFKLDYKDYFDFQEFNSNDPKADTALKDM